MVSIGDGLRMMQGGVDRTGYADMADAIGNPGLDLIRQRRQAAADEAALEALLASYDSGDSEDPKIEDKTSPELSVNLDPDILSGGMGEKALVGGLTGSLFGLPGVALGTLTAPVTQGYEDMMNRIVGEFDEGGSFEGGLSYGDEADYIDNLNKIMQMGTMQGLAFEKGGRVHLQGGGMDAGAGSLSGDKGFGAGVSKGVQDRMNRGGNKQDKINIPDKEVDIDQLEGDPLSTPSVSNYMGMTNIDPKLSYSIGSNLMQMQPPVADETSMLDQFSKYNLLDKTFDLGSGFTFGYDIDPSLKNLGDLSAEANLTYSFNQGGNVSGKISEDEKLLRLSDEDKFIQAQTVGDTELYNYLIGGEITPGLNFELGLMDDAIMEPGMTSPDDLKFFRLIKEF